MSNNFRVFGLSLWAKQGGEAEKEECVSKHRSAWRKSGRSPTGRGGFSWEAPRRKKSEKRSLNRNMAASPFWGGCHGLENQSY